ncbi:hypothetical protein HDU79_011313, partial [Rhizoclosmatium sp. JEL0117]
TLKGVLPAFRGNSDDMASVKVRSGTVIVMPEKGLSVKRWRDGIKWSPSRAYGNFLLYRQIETKNTNEPDDDDDTNPRPYSAPYGSTTGLQPTFTSKTLKEGTRIAKNGLTKRTITVKGSDGEKHRVISYYNSRDVMAMMRAAQRGEGGESLSAGLLRASEDENLRDAVKLSTADAIGLVKQLYPAFEVIVRQEIVKESPSKKVKLEGGVKLEDTIGPITAFTDPGRRTSKSLLHLYERDFVGYHPYRAGSLPYDEFKATPNAQYQQFGKQQQDRVEYAEARYKSQNRSHQQEHISYVATHHQSQSHHIQQQHFFQGYYQQPHHVQPQHLIYAPEVSRQHQQGFHPAPYPNYEWSFSGQYNHNKYQ